MQKYTRSVISIISGIIVAYLVIAGIRYVTYTPVSEVHYHANFAVFINGKQELFDGPGYYEEVLACSDDSQDNPRTRAHMHDNKAGLIHVHDERVTWGHFFENLGWSLHDTTLISPNGDVYQNNKLDDTALEFWLNGKRYNQGLANEVIKSEDRLLISYETSDEDVLSQQYNAVPATAAEANTTPDPASCQGHNHNTAGSRLRYAFDIR